MLCLLQAGNIKGPVSTKVLESQIFFEMLHTAETQEHLAIVSAEMSLSTSKLIRACKRWRPICFRRYHTEELKKQRHTANCVPDFIPEEEALSERLARMRNEMSNVAEHSERQEHRLQHTLREMHEELASAVILHSSTEFHYKIEAPKISVEKHDRGGCDVPVHLAKGHDYCWDRHPDDDGQGKGFTLTRSEKAVEHVQESREEWSKEQLDTVRAKSPAPTVGRFSDPCCAGKAACR